MSKLLNTLIPAMLSVAIFACGNTKSADPDAITPGIDARQLDARVVDAVPVLPDAPPANRGSLLFDGAGDFAQIPGTAAISTLTTITVEAWVKPLGTTSMRTLEAASRSGTTIWRA